MVVDAVAILQNCLSEPVSERAGSPPTRRHARPAFHAGCGDRGRRPRATCETNDTTTSVSPPHGPA